ncbi:hypothetical protein [Bdellovibrio sp. HCB2-146]|uniref:hypothetical protein n=1 Tax=Bdellovibrio sp. HCB2-146 TaxID=3394362 RepID=UPI0039BC66A2
MQHIREYELKIFSPQRAFRSVLLSRTNVRDCLLLTVVFEYLAMFALPHVQFIWSWAHHFLLGLIEIPGPPQFPNLTVRIVASIISACLLFFPRYFPDNWIPLRYFLRFLGFVLIMCVLFIDSISLSAEDLLQFQRNSMRYSLLLAPGLLAISLYLMPIHFGRKFLTTLSMLIFLFIFTPFLTASSWILMSELSLLILPLLFLVTGPLLFFAFYMCFFSWGMSGERR